MSYNISSDKFQHPLLKPILEKLTEYFSKEEIHFYVIGATARDIIMQIHDEKTGRATHDLDIAIAISNWDEFQKVEDGIVNIEGFEKDKAQKQRFIYLNDFQLDIVPFGEVMKEDDKIFWPPEEDIAMSILGFSEVNEDTHTVKIDDDIEIQIASLAGVFILKTVAWLDRNLKGNKDADDMAFIINNYHNINEQRAIEEHFDLYEVDEFDTQIAGSRLLGRDISNLLSESDSTKTKITEILKSEVEKEEDSRLINQILDTHKSFKYDNIYECLNNILQGLED
ncbi:nucleotidyl transferase AbiEii/AbiGii toxin family protein [uncultured Draconibacterium sp.]|uniref:nucleotidyl transferase AbiEii/AbiGii toxin family protein n=1 Tax=uncultured Draconibacterium sp. TaxID=1573823 RepID=UPI0025D73D64|nr:nucleotidyl transferase AbiEii/AbiGii toxin family protein [uncultured Draconibacterium sp.]